MGAHFQGKNTEWNPIDLRISVFSLDYGLANIDTMIIISVCLSSYELHFWYLIFLLFFKHDFHDPCDDIWYHEND